MIVESPFECVRHVADQLGECPRWDVVLGRLYWVDIKGRRFHCWDPETNDCVTSTVAEDIGCLVLDGRGHLIAGMRTGIWRLAPDGRQLECLARNPEGAEASRFNDGRADRNGNFWLGTIDEARKASAGLYRLSRSGLTVIETGLATSNGLAFSPDGRWMYHADTLRFTVYRYPLDASGDLAGEREVWLRFESSQASRARPDGAAVDESGCYWSALFEGGAVARFSPDGEWLATYPLPVRCPTMCAFGGSDMKTLYVTSARAGRSEQELSDYPLSGNLFAMRTDTPGLKEPRCAL